MGVIRDRWRAYERQQILDQLALVPSDLPGAMATDAEVSAAIATLASTTATEAELAAAVATVNTTLASKQDAAAAATALALKAPLASPAFTGAPTKNGSPVQSATDVADAYARVFAVDAPTVLPSVNRLAIQNKLDAAATAGGGTVDLATGQQYLVDMVVHPETSTIGCAVYIDSNVRLRGPGGASIKLQNGQTAPTGTTGTTAGGGLQLHIVSMRRPYSNLLNSHQGIVVEDLTIDGNATNQTDVFHGLWLNRLRSGWVNRVKVKNVRGTASSGAAETFHFEANNCTDVHFTSCEAVCDDASDTAAGFSADNSTNVTWVDCAARGMTHSNGFTHWQCANLTYSACTAYGNAAFGFNTERSEGITYTACKAGFRSAPVVSADPLPFWSSVQQQTGNAFGGFVNQGSKIVDYIACQARYNTATALQLKDNTTISPTMVCDQVRIIGGQYGPGNGRGLDIAATSTNVVLVGHVETTGNTAVDLVGSGAADNIIAATAAAPFVIYRNLNDSSGMRFNVVRTNGTGAPTGGSAYRWYSGGTLALTIGTDLSLAVAGGLKTALVSKTGTYTITNLDSVVLANGTFTLTLPSAVTAGAGRQYVIKNTGAGTITVAATAGTVETTSLAAGVGKKYVSDGTNWYTVN